MLNLKGLMKQNKRYKHISGAMFDYHKAQMLTFTDNLYQILKNRLIYGK